MVGPSMDSSEGAEVRALGRRLRKIADAEGGSTFMSWPDRWWEGNNRRCIHGHVSTYVLLSEALGRNACLASREVAPGVSKPCLAPVHLTFPEDRDGPLS